jgi:hypothetical protein
MGCFVFQNASLFFFFLLPLWYSSSMTKKKWGKKFFFFSCLSFTRAQSSVNPLWCLNLIHKVTNQTVAPVQVLVVEKVLCKSTHQNLAREEGSLLDRGDYEKTQTRFPTQTL